MIRSQEIPKNDEKNPEIFWIEGTEIGSYELHWPVVFHSEEPQWWLTVRDIQGHLRPEKVFAVCTPKKTYLKHRSPQEVWPGCLGYQKKHSLKARASSPLKISAFYQSKLRIVFQLPTIFKGKNVSFREGNYFIKHRVLKCGDDIDGPIPFLRRSGKKTVAPPGSHGTSSWCWWSLVLGEGS